MQKNNRKILIKNNTSGFILVSMVIMLLVISLTAMTMNRRAGMGSRMSANHVYAIKTTFGQESATQYALWRLKNNPDWRTAAGGDPFVFNGETYTLKVLNSTVAGYEDVIRISGVLLGGTKATVVGVRITQPPSLTGVYFCDTDNACVREIDPATGIIRTLAGQGGTVGYAGDGGPADEALISKALGVTGDLAGNIFIADTGNNCIRRVDPAGIITTIAGSGSGVGGTSGDNGPAVDAEFNSPMAIVIDGNGNLFIADRSNSAIRRIDAATGIITTVAGLLGDQGYSGDGGLATLATINRPEGIAVDSAGNLFISDTKNECIRRVDGVSRIIITVKSGFGDNLTITADADDNLFIVDNADDVVLKIDATTGNMTVVAGIFNDAGYNGDNILATLAHLNSPEGALGMANGDIYIADANNDRIRKVNGATGFITTIAGNGTGGFAGDGGLAVDALISGPAGVYYAPGESGDPTLTIVKEIY
jgi:streptogramin lyase